MLVLSPTWIWLIFWTVIAHWLLPARYRTIWLIAVSAIFIGWFSPLSLLLLSSLTTIFYLSAGRHHNISGKKLLMLIGLAGCILSLFKLEVSLTAQNTLDLTPLEQDFLIPLGLSYYAFRVIHYAIEKYKGTIPPHGPVTFIAYLFFLPTLIAGPIHRFPEFERDLKRKRWDPYMIARGIERLLIGYFKIAFLANLLAYNYFTGYIMSLPETQTFLITYLEMLRDFLNLYFLFSGFSDIAIGCSLLFGFKVMENFNFPFLAQNISDFWRRWHISLTSWCRDYVYMGTLSLSRSPALAAVAAMMVMGLWHEFSVRYIVWALFHGAGIMIWQKFQNVKPLMPQIKNRIALFPLKVLSTLLTLHYFMFGMLIVYNDTLTIAFGKMTTLLLFW